LSSELYLEPDVNKTIVHSLYSDLLKLMNQEYGYDFNSWFPSILDTIALAQWKLKIENNKAELMRLFNIALNNELVIPSPSEQNLIQSHIDELNFKFN
jgi:hypothetical protein